MSEPFVGQIMAVPYTFAPSQWAFCYGQAMQMNQFQALYALLGVQYGGNAQTTFNLPDLRGRVMLGGGTPNGSTTTYSPGNIGGQAETVLNPNQLPAHTHPATFTPTGSGGGGAAQTATGTVSLPVTGTLDSTPVSVSGSLVATDTVATQDVPQAGWTLGDVTGISKVYAPAGGNSISLAPITSTGNVSGSITGTASGTVTLNVSGAASGGGTVQVQGNPTGYLAVPTMPPYVVVNNIIALMGIFPSRD